MDSTLLDEYLLEYELIIAEQEMYETLFQLECGITTESVGLMSVNESVVDTIKEWFKKILHSIETAIEKLKFKIKGTFEENLESIAAKMESGNRPDPAPMTVSNFHTYDLSKFDNYKAAAAFNKPEYNEIIAGMVGANQKTAITNREELLKLVFPDLYDEKLSVFDKLRLEILTSDEVSGKQNLTQDMIQYAWDFCRKDYDKSIKSIEADQAAIDAQKTQVEKAAEALANAMTSAVNGTQESYLYESFLLEADEKKESTKQAVQDPETEDTGENNSSKKDYAKAMTAYIGIVTMVVSAKMKILNIAYLDKFMLIKAYAKHCEWKMGKPKKNK